MKYPLKICSWCNEENPTEYHAINCAQTFKPKQFVPKNEWISVDDRLPNYLEEVIVIHNGIESIYAIHAGNNSWYRYALVDFEKERIELDPIGPGRISLWMQLPQTPKETKE